MYRYKIADIVFDATYRYKYTYEMSKNYLYDGAEQPAFSMDITEQDILNEKQAKGAEGFSDAYLESLVMFRKLCTFAVENSNAILFHCSAVEVDGKAYLFTAPSGTGKSTHARLWREYLGDKVKMINDDKPIIRFIDGAFYVYGTPWNGKHHLDTNGRAKIQAICEIRQAKENSIAEISPAEMLMVVLKQTLHFEDETSMINLLDLLNVLLKSVKLYRLQCTISEEAAKLSYGTMSKGE